MKKYLIFLLVNFVIIISNVNAATFVVSSTSDNDNGLSYSNPSTAENTLRKCIRLANAAGAGPHTITFAISAGPYQITLTNTGYQINNSQITIDATSQSGWSPAQTPIVILNGNGQQYAFQLNAGSTVIKGFVIQNFSQYGMQINSGSNSNVISNCWIGVNSTGTSIVGSTQYGISISSNSNTIGSTTVFDVSTRNIISGCQTGINIQNGSSNLISNNYIGTDVNGTSALANSNYGIYVNGSAASNTIGSTTSIPANLISGNSKVGVYFESASTNNTVAGNYIGTNISGSAALANGTNEPQNDHGIYANNTQSITIDRNVISGNIGLGIYLNASAGNSSSFAKIIGNKIGTDATGMSRIANTAGGIRIDNSSSITIGFDGNAASNTVTQRNIISGNGGATHAVNGPATTYDMNNQCGIYLFAKDNNITNVSIAGNYIGVKSNGLDTLGNKASGVKFEAANWTSYICSQNTIGGTDYRFRNIIGGNGFNSIQVAHGILLKEKNTSNNTITMNFIGIGADGKTPVGNRQDGISFLGGQNNTIGGAGVENVISNNEWGVFLQSNFGGVQASGNTIAGNFIGTDSTGNSSSTSLGNGRRAIDSDGGGIGIQHGSNSNLIGTAYAANIIGENYNGIVLRSSGNGGPPYSNIVQNNYVGVGKDGSSSIANLYTGILISQGAKSNTIGSTSLSNVVVNNGKYGIELDSAQSNTIVGNYIGVTKNLVAAGNVQDGINIHNGSSKNIIGGATGSGNYIGNNGGNGVGFSNPNASGSTLNAINNNSIFCNGGRGIVLNGGNSSYAAPTFSGTPTSFTVTGTAGSWIELYSLDGCNDCSTASNNKLQGKTLVASGASPLSYTPTGGKTNLDFTATASSGTPTGSPAYHNTSEFSVCQVLCATPTTANAGTDQNICGATIATLAGNAPTTGTGSWSVVSGTATITNAASNTSGITGLAANGTVTLRWSISTGTGCTPSTDDVVINTNTTPTTANAAADIPVCGSTSSTLAGNSPTSGTGTWSVVSGTATITNPTSATSGVTGLAANGTVTLRWTIANGPGCSTASTDDVVINTNTTPTTANAGADIPVCGSTSTTLAGNSPTSGTGTWSVVSGTATITNATSATSGVTGLAPNGSATLKWTISNGVCTSSSDDVVINTNTSPTTANAGADIPVCGSTSTTLVGNSPTSGTGTWSVVSGTATITNSTSATSGVTGLAANGSATLRWTISNGVCTSSTDDVVINTNTTPTTAAAGSDLNVCGGTTATLSGNSPTSGTGTWSVVSGTATITNPTSATSGVAGLAANGTATLRWTISNGPGCSTLSTDDVVINTNTTPTTANAGADIPVCGSTSTTLAGNNPNSGTGTWSVVSGTATITDPSLYNSGVTGLAADGSATLRWTISNGVCTSSVDDVVINTNTAPTIADAGIDVPVCGSTDATLNGNVPSTGTGTWSVVSGTATITNASSNTSGVTGLVTNGSATLRWTISNGVCTPSSDDVVINTNTTPTTSAAGSDINMCGGTTATLAGNNPTSGIGTWSVVSGTATITNPTSATSGITGLSANGNVTLRWTISNGPGCSTPSTDDVVINTNTTPTSADAGADIPVCGSTSTTLSGNNPISGTGTWSVVSGTATILNPSLYNSGVTGLVTDGSATLRWTISNGICAASTDDVVINTNTAPTTADAGVDIPVCGSTDATLNGNVPSVGTGAWSVISGNATITDITLATSGITGLAANGSATLRWTISNGVCKPSADDVVINTNTTPSTADAGSNASLCGSTSTTLVGNNPTSGIGTWSVISGTATITDPSIYNSGVTSLAVNGTATLRWTVSNGPGCSTTSTADVTITTNENPTTANAGSDIPVCGSTVASLNANNPSVGSGSWIVISGNATIANPSSPASNVTGLDANGSVTIRWTISNGVCTPSTDDVVINTNTPPTVASAGSDIPVCGSTSTSLNGNIPTTGNGVWSVIQPNTAIVDNPTQPVSTVSNLSVGSTLCVWTISNGVCASSSDTVVVDKKADTPTSTITSDDRTICGGNIAINANAVSINGLSGQWTSNPANITFNDASSASTVAAGFQNDTTILYWTISGPCGNSSDSMIVAITSSSYKVSALPHKDSLCNGTSANINVDVTGNAIAPYTYYYVSSDSSFKEVTANSSVTVTPSGNGWTYYYIYVMDSQNCKSINLAKDSLYSMNKQELIVPNLITPNLDGLNDCFIIKDIYGYDILPGSVFNLYNRWGEPVYRINNYKNGDFCGSILVDGIYYYHLETGCGKEEIKGWLQIMSNTESLNR